MMHTSGREEDVEMGVWCYKDRQNKKMAELEGQRKWETYKKLEESAGKMVKVVRTCHENG